VEIGLLGGLLAMALTWLVHGMLAPDALLQARAAAEARVLAAGGDAQAVANAVGLGSPFGRAILRFVEVMVTAILCGLAFARTPRDP